MEKSVCVLVGGKRTLLDHVKRSATAGDIIKRFVKAFKTESSSSKDFEAVLRALELCVRLQPAGASRRRRGYVLLESWEGCSRVIEQNERIEGVLDQWGLQHDSGEAILELVRKNKSNLYQQRRVASSCGRVAARKRNILKSLHPCSQNSWRAKLNSIYRLINRTRREYKIVTTPTKPPQEQLSSSMDASSLPPELEEEFVALQEGLAEEEKENSDFLRRREELVCNTQSQNREIETLQETLSTMEAKVKNEEHKLTRLIETTGPPELEDAQKEVSRLQNDLNVRTTLNKLQASKLKELGNAVSKIDQDIQSTMKQIETLTLSVN